MLHLPPLYPVTDATRPEPLSVQIRRLGQAGFPLVQFRGKPLDHRTQWEELRKARRESGLTQEQLASKAKLHPTYIGLLERNKCSPNLEVFLRLCAAMKVSPLTLLKRIMARRGAKGRE